MWKTECEWNGIQFEWKIEFEKDAIYFSYVFLQSGLCYNLMLIFFQLLYAIYLNSI